MRSASGDHRTVVIAGAGIAGMTAALYLLEAGFDVAILEKRDHVGGKFGAVRVSDATVHEHAYHFLGDWCVNLRAVMEKIGLGTPHLQPSHGVSFLRPRRHGGPLSARLATLRLEELGTLFSENLHCGVIPPDDMMIWFYSLLELVSYGRDLDDKEFLSRISVNGFMRSLPYMTDLAALLHQEALVKAFAIPSYETSARSYRRFARFFSRDQHGRILKKAVDVDFWPAFKTGLRKHKREDGPGDDGPDWPILYNTSLEEIEVKYRGKRPRVSRIYVNRRGVVERWDGVDHLLITVPHLDLASIVERSPTLRGAAPALLELRKLKSRQMASLDVYFRRPLAGIPREHVTLIDDSPFTEPGEVAAGRRRARPATDPRKLTLATHGNRLGSRFALSFVDNYQAWHGGGRDKTWLNVVAADFEELEKLGKDEAAREMLKELAKYVTFAPSDIEWDRTDLQLNDDAPLFTNTVGSWQYRPECGAYSDRFRPAPFENLYLAGDYCRSPVDVVCLEGAVFTARVAARAIAERAGRRDSVSEPDVPAEVSLQQVERLKQELEPWLRLAASRSFGARERLGPASGGPGLE